MRSANWRPENVPGEVSPGPSRMRNIDIISEFRRRHDRSVIPSYETREARNRWAATFLKSLPGKSVLNLGGGGQRYLERHLGPPWRVHEVDIAGDCDTKLDLDGIDRLPFDDEAFDTCCAFDVLEHLEQFHFMVEEMHRVSKSTMLISLPNAATELLAIWCNVRAFNDPSQNGVYSKYYGLPISPPKDRHRWWLSFEDIIRLFVSFEARTSSTVEFYLPDDEFSLKRKVFRFLAGERLYLNFFCSSIWVKISKRGALTSASSLNRPTS